MYTLHMHSHTTLAHNRELCLQRVSNLLARGLGHGSTPNFGFLSVKQNKENNSTDTPPDLCEMSLVCVGAQQMLVLKVIL